MQPICNRERQSQFPAARRAPLARFSPNLTTRRQRARAESRPHCRRLTAPSWSLLPNHTGPPGPTVGHAFREYTLFPTMQSPRRPRSSCSRSREIAATVTASASFPNHGASRSGFQTALVPSLPAAGHGASPALPASARLSASGRIRSVRRSAPPTTARHRCDAAPTARGAPGCPSGQRGLFRHPSRRKAEFRRRSGLRSLGSRVWRSALGRRARLRPPRPAPANAFASLHFSAARGRRRAARYARRKGARALARRALATPSLGGNSIGSAHKIVPNAHHRRPECQLTPGPKREAMSPYERGRITKGAKGHCLPCTCPPACPRRLGIPFPWVFGSRPNF